VRQGRQIIIRIKALCRPVRSAALLLLLSPLLEVSHAEDSRYVESNEAMYGVMTKKLGCSCDVGFRAQGVVRFGCDCNGCAQRIADVYIGGLSQVTSAFHAMPQVCIDRFHRIGFRLLRSPLKWKAIVQVAIDWKRITYVMMV